MTAPPLVQSGPTFDARNEAQFRRQLEQSLAAMQALLGRAVIVDANGNATVTGSVFTTVGLGVGNSVAATTLGTVVGKVEIFDTDGASLGFLPLYDAIT